MRFIQTFSISLLVTCPVFTHAQEDLFSLGEGILTLFNNYLIPLLITLAVLFFVVNVTRYFIIESDDTESRAVARQLGMYGILALVFIVSFWGIVNFFVMSFGFVEDECYPVPDWIGDERCGEGPDVTSSLEGGDAFGGGTEFGDTDFGDTDFGAEIGGSGDSTPDSTPPPGLSTPDSTSGDTPDVGSPPPTGEGPLLGAQADVTDDVSDYFSELQNGDTDLAAAGPLLAEADIFADLDDFSGNYNDLDRLQAAYRLNQLGELGDAEYANLVSRTNNYRAETGLLPISDSVIQDIAVPKSEWPSELTSERDALIADRVAEYNTDPLVDDIDVTNIEFLLASPSLSLEERYDNFNTLYDDPAMTALLTDDFTEDYLGYLNAERVLSGENLDDLFN